MQPAALLPADLLKENEALRIRLEEAEDMLRALRGGDADAVVVQTATGPLVYTLQGQDAEASRLRGGMLEQVSDAIIVVDESGLVTFLNAAAGHLYGRSASNAMARPLADIFSTRWLRADDETAAAIALREHGEWHGETVHVRRDGHALHVEASITGIKGKEGQETGRIAVIRDVSERKQQERRMLVSELRYRRLFEAAHDGVLIVDPDTRKIIDANPFMTQLLGYPLGALVGVELFEIGFLGDAQASQEMFRTLSATGQ